MNIKFTNEVAVTATVVWAVAVIHSPVLAAAVVLLAAVMTLVLPTTPEDGRRGTILGLNTRLLVYRHRHTQTHTHTHTRRAVNKFTVGIKYINLLDVAEQYILDQ